MAIRSEVEVQYCKAHKKSGKPCRNRPIKGATVCYRHGGAAPQVREAARRRLDMALDDVARQLLAIASDPDVPAATRLAAVRDVLDRGDLTGKTRVEVTGESKFEVTFAGLARDIGPSALPASEPDTGAVPDFRGLNDRPQVPLLLGDDIVDAELVDDPAPHPVAAPATQETFTLAEVMAGGLKRRGRPARPGRD